MPNTNLSDEDVIALVRKEFERKLASFCAEHGLEEPQVEADDEDVEDDDGEDGGDDVEKPKKPKYIETEDLAVGIRVRHKGSGLAYTVSSMNLTTGALELRTPENDIFTVTGEEVEAEYGLD